LQLFLAVAFLSSCSQSGPKKISKEQTSSLSGQDDSTLAGKTLLLAEAVSFWEEGKNLFKDSLFIEAGSVLDSALLRLYQARQSINLDSAEIFEINSLRDTVIQYLVLAGAGARNQTNLYSWNPEIDSVYQGVSVEDLEETDTLLVGINLENFSLPLELPLNPRIKKAIAFFTGPGRKTFGTWLDRSEKFKQLILPEIKKAGLPADLVYLSMIESGFNPKAYSPAAASGLWQFIEPTGRRYGLEHNWWIDERRDILLSTRAALAYLGDLYREFKDWNMAMAAYNCGENRIRRQLRLDSSVTYWRMNLPRETDLYVPRILAAMIISSNPEKFGFTPQFEALLEWDTLTVFHPLSLESVSQCLQREESEIHDLNPDLRRWTTPPSAQSHVLKIPLGTRDQFQSCYEAMDKTQLVRMQQHRVRRKETLAGIAIRFGVSIKSIQRANGLKSRRIKVGQTLVIPLTALAGASTGSSPEPLAVAPATNLNSVLPSEYRVRSGDNLFDIARSHQVSIQHIQEANNLTSGSIFVGQKLIIPPSNQGQALSGTPHRQRQPVYGVYRVRRGENLGIIARKLDVTPVQLKIWNKLRSTRIHPGQKLKYRKGYEYVWVNVPIPPNLQVAPSSQSQDDSTRVGLVPEGLSEADSFNVSGLTESNSEVSYVGYSDSLKSTDLLPPSTVHVPDADGETNSSQENILEDQGQALIENLDNLISQENILENHSSPTQAETAIAQPTYEMQSEVKSQPESALDSDQEWSPKTKLPRPQVQPPKATEGVRKRAPKNLPLKKNSYYRVRRGDNLWLIARRHNTTISKLTQLNPGLSEDVRPGKVIVLP